MNKKATSWIAEHLADVIIMSLVLLLVLIIILVATGVLSTEWLKIGKFNVFVK